MQQSLEAIGFYTLSDARAANVTDSTPLWRCELILTDVCNFKCPYCRGIEKEHARSLTWEEASFVVDMWASQGLKNIRFSGGEPTMWKCYETTPEGSTVRRNLADLICRAKQKGIERIAISTNGSVAPKVYQELLEAGVTDFSISLDACCAETGDKMAGNVTGAWKRVTDNIRDLAKKAYVTVGVVFTSENIQEFEDIVRFASDDLGVSDIRILSSAQWNASFSDVHVSDEFLSAHPILRYRIRNFQAGKHVRGISPADANKCYLMLDDMAILDGQHYPCIIYLREQGLPVGSLDTSLSPAAAMAKARKERLNWVAHNNTHLDPICRKNCLDVCVDYNNKVRETNTCVEQVLAQVEAGPRVIPIRLSGA